MGSIMKRVDIALLLFMLLTFASCLNPAPTKTVGVEENAFEEEKSIKSFIQAQYRDYYEGFELVRWQSFRSTIGGGYYGIIKFTYYENGEKMFAVNNVTADKDGYIEKISYSSSYRYKDLPFIP